MLTMLLDHVFDNIRVCYFGVCGECWLSVSLQTKQTSVSTDGPTYGAGGQRLNPIMNFDLCLACAFLAQSLSQIGSDAS